MVSGNLFWSVQATNHLVPTHSKKMEIAVDLVTDLAEKLRGDAKRLEEEKEKIRRNIESLLEMIKSGEMSSLSAGNFFF